MYVRDYYNDNKITIMGDSKNTEIVFASNDKDPSKGFELATSNIEGFFHQRSTRK